MDKLDHIKLTKIQNPKGDLFHLVKDTDAHFKGFGEAYITSIHTDMIKGWKRHTQMQLCLTVVSGRVRFVGYDAGSFQTFLLDSSFPSKLIVPPKRWLAFQGIGDTNRILNIADMRHDPNEAESVPIETFSFFGWNASATG